MRNQLLADIQSRQHKVAQGRLQALFYFITALLSAGYIAYVIAFSLMVERVTGSDSYALILMAAFLLLETFLEVPTGALADIYGNRLAIKWSFTTLAAHSAIYLVVALMLPETPGFHTLLFWLIIASETLLAIGTCLHSGSINAWFVRQMKAEGYTGELTKFMSRRRLTTNVTWWIVGVVVVMFKNADPNYIFLAFIIGLICHVAALMVGLKQMPGRKSVEGKFSWKKFLRQIKEEFYGALGELLQNVKLLIVAFTHSVFWALGVTLAFFWDDLIGDRAGKSERVYIWTAISLARIVGSEVANRFGIGKKQGLDSRVKTFVMGQALLSIPMIALVYMRDFTFVGPIWLFGLTIALSRLGQEVSKPIAMAWTHEGVHNERFRATTESLIEASAGAVLTAVVTAVLISRTIAGDPQTEEEKKLIAAGQERLLYSVIAILACVTFFINIPLAWFVSHVIKRQVRFGKPAREPAAS